MPTCASVTDIRNVNSAFANAYHKVPTALSHLCISKSSSIAPVGGTQVIDPNATVCHRVDREPVQITFNFFLFVCSHCGITLNLWSLLDQFKIYAEADTQIGGLRRDGENDPVGRANYVYCSV